VADPTNLVYVGDKQKQDNYNFYSFNKLQTESNCFILFLIWFPYKSSIKQYRLYYLQKQLFLTHSIPTPENIVFLGVFCCRFGRVFDAPPRKGLDRVEKQFGQLLRIARKLPDYKYKLALLYQFKEFEKVVWMMPGGRKVKIIT